MKIALVTGEYWPFIKGGCGVSSTLLVNQLRERGVLVDVFVFGSSHESILSEMGTTFYFNTAEDPISRVLNLQVIKELRKKLNSYDLVHLYSISRITALGFMKQLGLKVPVVATLNGEEAACIYFRRWMRLKCLKCYPIDALICSIHRSRAGELSLPFIFLPTYFIIQRFFAKKIDEYFALSNVIKDLYVCSGFPEEKIKIIPNMYDPEFLKALELIKIPKSDNKIIILYAGRLVRDKGVEDLIKAFLKISSENAELWIAGDGPEAENLKRISKASCKEKQIKFLGFLDLNQLAITYKKANIFVHPGIWPEPFGRTILEAMLARLAIVTSNVGAPPEILGDAGVFYESGNVDGLSQKIKFLIDNKQFRQDLCSKAFDKVLSNYSPSMVTTQIIDEYNRLIRK